MTHGGPPATAARARVSDRVVDELRAFIHSNGLAPGSKLPGERLLVEAFGVSRSSLREAIRVLATLGVLEAKHGDGVYVRTPEVVRATDTPPAVELASEPLRDLVEARLGVELAAATAVAERGAEPDFIVLDRLLDDHAAAVRRGDQEPWPPMSFELAVVRLSGNTLLIAFEESLLERWIATWAGRTFDGHRYDEWVAEHRAVLASLRTGNVAQVQRLLVAHLNVERLELERS